MQLRILPKKGLLAKIRGLEDFGTAFRFAAQKRGRVNLRKAVFVEKSLHAFDNFCLNPENCNVFGFSQIKAPIVKPCIQKRPGFLRFNLQWQFRLRRSDSPDFRRYDFKTPGCLLVIFYNTFYSYNGLACDFRYLIHDLELDDPMLCGNLDCTFAVCKLDK